MSGGGAGASKSRQKRGDDGKTFTPRLERDFENEAGAGGERSQNRDTGKAGKHQGG